MIKRLIDFIKNGIWETDPSGKGRSGWAIRPFKIMIYTVRGIGEHGIFLRASALTYYTLLSLVPIAALIFGFMKGFGFDANIWEWLYGKVPGFETSLDYLRTWVDNTLVHTRGGVLAAAGILMLFWAVIRVFTNVEDAFNNIWEVRKTRPVARMLSDYLSVVIVAPVLLVSASGLSSLMRGVLEPWVWTPLLNVVFAFAELLLTWALFAFVYWIMPYTRVKFKGALIAALIAGTAFWLFQEIYFLLQGNLSDYNAIYGTFAAIPLLLVWLQTSWVLVLVGAELSFAYQNIDRYELERDAVTMNANNKRKILVAAMVVVVRHFMDGKGAVTSEHIAGELKLPVRSVRDVVYELGLAGLVVAVKTPHDNRESSYVPAHDIHGLTVYDVVDSVENMSSDRLNVSGLPELQKVSKLLDRVIEKSKADGMQTKLTELL